MKIFFEKILLLFAATVFTFLLLELSARIFLPPAQLAKVEHSTNKSIGVKNTEKKQFDLQNDVYENQDFYINTENGRRMRANSIAKIEHHTYNGKNVELRTNSLGYRNPEIGEKRFKRVLFLGDSVTSVNYLAEEETWVRLIENISREKNYPLETINAGVTAIGLADELAILIETGLSVNPDIVVLGYYLNDVDPSPGVRMIKTPKYFEWSRLAKLILERSSILRSKYIYDEEFIKSDLDVKRWKNEISGQFLSNKSKKPSFAQEILDNTFDWGAAWSDEVWEIQKPIFEEFKRLSIIEGFKLLIVSFPVEQQVIARDLHDYPQQKLKEIAKSLGIPVLDVLPLLREEKRKGSPRLFYDWCHYTDKGNQLLAKWIFDFIQREVS